MDPPQCGFSRSKLVCFYIVYQCYKVLAKERRGCVLVLFDSNLIGCQGTHVIMYIVKYYIEMTKAVKHEHVIMYSDEKIVHLFMCFRFRYGLK